jgi:hypothetical protein
MGEQAKEVVNGTSRIISANFRQVANQRQVVQSNIRLHNRLLVDSCCNLALGRLLVADIFISLSHTAMDVKVP